MGSLPNRFDSHHDVHFIISEALKRQVPQSLGDVTVQLAALHVELGENSVKAMRLFLRLHSIDRRRGLTVRRHLKAVERSIHSTTQCNATCPLTNKHLFTSKKTMALLLKFLHTSAAIIASLPRSSSFLTLTNS